MYLDRSLKNGRNNCYLEDESHMITLDRLAVGGYFQNNRQMIVNSCWPVPRLFQVLRYMNNLEKLNLLECHVTLTEELPQLFRWCPKLIELHLTTFESQELEMYEGLKNELRSGFQRLRLLELEWGIDSWSVIVEIFT